jgi:hypothetical protein
MEYAQQQFAQAPRQRPDPIERPGAIERPGTAPQRAPQRQAPSRLEQDVLRAAPRIEATPAPREPALRDASLDPQGGIQGTVGTRPGRFGMVPPGVSMAGAHPTPEMTLDARMQDRVAKERDQGGVGLAIDDTVRTLMRGTPVGSWLDEANAGIDAGLNKITGGRIGMPYDERMAYEKARNQAVDKSASPLFSTGLGTVDTADVQKVLGGLLSIPASPVSSVIQGASILPRLGNALLTGMAYGGVYGAGEGEGTERLGNAGTGLAIGGALGPATTLLGSGVSNTYGALSRLMNRPQGATAGMSKPAVRNVAQSMDADNLPATYQQRVAELGPEGMLADMGDNLRLDAGRIARNPGQGRTTILDALNARKETAPARLRADADAALGPPVNVPEVSEQIRKSANAKAGPFYRAFEQENIKRTAPLENIIKRAEAGGLLSSAKKRIEMEGFDPDLPQNLPRLLNRIKIEADDASSAAFRAGRRGEGQSYANIARAIKTQIEWQTRQRVFQVNSQGSAKAVVYPSNYKQARQLAAPGQAIPEAIEEGQSAFSKGLSPDQMAADLRKMNLPAQTAYRYGARDQVRQIMGNSATAYGPNADTAARKLFASDNARQKLDMIAKPGGADRLIRRGNAETTFERTRDVADRNSITSTMQAAERRWPGQDDLAVKGAAVRNASLPGIFMEQALKIANTVSGGALNERNLRIQADAARMLVAQGADRDAVARALLQFAQRNNLTGQRRAAIDQIVRAVATAPRQALIEAANE